MPCFKAAAVELNGKIYVLGGYLPLALTSDDEKKQKSSPKHQASSYMSIYDIKSDVWTQGPELPVAVLKPQVVTNGNLVFLLTNDSLYSYAPTTMIWKRLTVPNEKERATNSTGGELLYDMNHNGGGIAIL